MAFIIGDSSGFDANAFEAQARQHQVAAGYDEPVTVVMEQVTSRSSGAVLEKRMAVYRKYAYRTLKGDRDIRLLKLSRSHGFNSLRGALEEFSLEKTPTFIALSYTWGSGDPKHPLILGDRIIHIRENLYQALLKILKLDIEFIWIDAICIHLSDETEAANQVMLMRDIYFKAGCVIVDLGVAPDADPMLLEFLKNIKNVRDLHPTVDGSDQYDQFDWDNLQRYGLPTFDDGRWISLGKFLERPWFNRVWVMQEFAYSKNVAFLCDQWSMELDDIISIFGAIYNFGLAAHPKISRQAGLAINRLALMMKLRHEIIHDKTHRSLPTLLQLERFAEASRSHDHIFGTLGLAKESQAPQLKPNYSEDLESLCYRVAKYFANTSNALSLLNCASVRTRSPNIPYWVPFWGEASHTPVFEPDMWTGHLSPFFTAGGDTVCQAALEENEKILKMHGVIFDEVSEIAAPASFQPENEDLNVLEFIEEAMKLINIAEPFYPSHEKRSEVLWRLLLCDSRPAYHSRATQVESRYVNALILSESLKQAEKEGNERRSRAILSLEKAGDSFDDAGAAFLKRESTSAYLGIHRMAKSARMCATLRGYVCQAPREVEVRDVVVIFHGCNLPFILRPAGHDCYKVVGNCYVHGIMYGEGLGLPGIFSQDIRLV